MATLKVPGATLYYEVRGSGPVLLLICGGIYDADMYAGLADQLADAYTVVTYDRRGNSRSPLDDAPRPQLIADHAEDAYCVLTEVGVTAESRADVFGNSSGAIFGLELAAHHPHLVRTLVAHEPPVFELLPSREHWRSVMDKVENAFAADGVGAAMEAFNAGFVTAPPAEGDDAPATVEGGAQPAEGAEDDHQRQMSEAMAKNMAFFIGYEVPPVGRYRPELAVLRSGPTRIVIAVGEDSRGETPHQCGVALAKQLGTDPLLVPGDHGGFGVHPEAFAVSLRAILA